MDLVWQSYVSLSLSFFIFSISLEKEITTDFSILAWKIPWMEEPGKLQSMGSQRVRHDWVTSLHFSILDWKKKFQGQYKMKITFFYFYDFAYAFFFTSTIHYQNYFINLATPLLLFKSQQACTSDEIFNGLTQQFTHSWEVFCGSRQLYGALSLWWHGVQGRTHWNNTSVSIINFTHSPLTRDSHMAPTNNKMAWSQKWALSCI